jgi:nitroimidazol reductase NimA-like FMN-containing flavoprotein (pyridoxamine 5'-phosphate oxidase superfamily)
MAPLNRDLALTDAQLTELLDSEWNVRIATQGPGDRINLTPMWFVWHDGRMWLYCRGQKVVNLRRQPAVTVLVDRNTRFLELQGAMIQGRGRVLEDEAAEAAEPALVAVREMYGRKYNGGHGEPAGDPQPMAASARGRSMRWIVIEPDNIVTWDNFKLRR